MVFRRGSEGSKVGDVEHLLKDAIEAYRQAFQELFQPPCSFLGAASRGWSEGFSSIKGFVGIPAEQALRADNPKLYLLWYYRHTLSHAHYCPYDIATADLLYRSALEVVSSRAIAKLALTLFSDIQVDCIYLPARFEEEPYHVLVDLSAGELKPPLDIYYAVYRVFHPKIRRRRLSKELEVYGGMIAGVMVQPKTWIAKVRDVAAILYRLGWYKGVLYDRRVVDRMRRMPIILREDLGDRGVDRIAEEALGKAKNREEAKALYEEWIKPRLTGEKKLAGRRSMFERSGEKISRVSGIREPRIPTRYSKLLRKLNKDKLEEALWLRYWYKARALATILEYSMYIGERGIRVKDDAYPIEWSIEDEIEDLDIEASVDEGRLRLEVNTTKWVQTELQGGAIPKEGVSPYVVVVLDTSSSMTPAYDPASIAGFIAYINAIRNGGKASIVNFSSKYLEASWNDDDELKEILLSYHQGELTILPTHIVRKLVEDARTRCFIVIITDGGFQNIEEAYKDLEKIVDYEHQIVLLHIQQGGYYPDNIRRLSEINRITIHRVYDPNVDLSRIVLKYTFHPQYGY
ncbi:MAG: vWA domain-containing protein [Nitrososphaerota archaeon]|nr:VWA domain-containing protein [Candidatus Bathyarchaeota archaeon]MDW8061774.1 vWA domain-containing protein [Nitrososphaerota archaeon]